MLDKYLVSTYWQKLNLRGAMSFVPTGDLPLQSSCGQCRGAEDTGAFLDWEAALEEVAQ